MNLNLFENAYNYYNFSVSSKEDVAQTLRELFAGYIGDQMYARYDIADNWFRRPLKQRDEWNESAGRRRPWTKDSVMIVAHEDGMRFHIGSLAYEQIVDTPIENDFTQDREIMGPLTDAMTKVIDGLKGDGMYDVNIWGLKGDVFDRVRLCQMLESSLVAMEHWETLPNR